MWMEAQAICNVIAMICIAIVISQLFLVAQIFVFILFVAIAMIIFGNILIGSRISRFKPLFETTPTGWELMELQLLDGRTYFINTKKGAYGQRKFRINGEDATVINDGECNFTLHNGNRGFRAHELFDGNVDPFMAKALEKMQGEDVKEIYYNARQKQRGVKFE